MTIPSIEALARFLASERNLWILRYLSQGCSYVSELARHLGLDPSDVSRRLARAEALGLVEARKVRALRGGSVKLYCLRVRELLLDIPRGMVRLGEAPGTGGRRGGRRVLLIGREREVDSVQSRAGELRLVEITGPPQSGKTTLAQYLVVEVYGDRPSIRLTVSPGETVESFSRKLGMELGLLGYPVPAGQVSIEQGREDIVSFLNEHEAVVVIDEVHNARRGVADFIRYLAETAYAGRITLILAGRSRLPGIPRWIEGYLSIELGPVSPRAWARIASIAGGVEVGEWEARAAAERIPLLPGHAVKYGRIRASLADPERALERLERIVSEGGLSLLLASHTQRLIIALVSAAGGPLPVDALCSAVERSQCSTCRSEVRELASLGVLEYYNGLVELNDYYRREASRITAPGLQEAMVELGQALARHPEYHWRVRGLQILAEACRPLSVARIAEERLRTGASWPFYDTTGYIEALNRALSCGLQGSRKVIVEAEKAVFEHGLARPLEAALVLEGAYDYLRNRGYRGEALLLRLASLAALFYTQGRRTDKAGELLEEAGELAERVQDPHALSTYYSNLITFLMRRAYDELDLRPVLQAVEVAERLLPLEGLDEEEYFWALSIRAELDRLIGNLDRAEETLRSLITSLEEAGLTYAPVYYNSVVSLTYVLLEKGLDGDPRLLEKAEELVERALQRALGLRLGPASSDYVAWLSADLALVKAARGDVEAARRLFPRDMCSRSDETWIDRCLLYTVAVEGRDPGPLPPWVARIASKIPRRGRGEAGT